MRRLLKPPQRLTFQVSSVGREHEGVRVGGFNGARLKTVRAAAARVLLVRAWLRCKGAWVISLFPSCEDTVSCVFRKKSKMTLASGLAVSATKM